MKTPSPTNKYLREFWQEDIRGHYLDTAVIFAVLLLFDYVLCSLNPKIAEKIVSLFTLQVAGEIIELGGLGLAFELLLGNIISLFEAVLIGLIPFLHLSMISLVVNTFILSAFAVYYQQNGPGLAAYLVGVLPHGIFEFAAMLLCITLGLRLCSRVTDRVRGRSKDTRGILASFGISVQFFWRVAAPLLVLSALIEAFITPVLLEALLA